MRITAISACALLIAGTLAAQGGRFNYVSPRGAEYFEGNSSSNIMLGNYGTGTRVQQIDNNLVGATLPAIRYIGWRRNGAGGGVAGKSVTLEIVMSHADFATVTNTWANNYKDTPRTVFKQKTVKLPDWSGALNAARFDVYVPLDAPFVYNRKDALLWDVKNINNNNTQAMPQDWHSTTIAHTYGDYPSNLGGGCTTSNGVFQNETMFRADAATLEFGVQVKEGPSNAAIFALLGATDPNIPVPGFCGTLHSDAFLILSAGQTDGAGEMAVKTLISVPWSANYVGVQLYSQLLAFDAAATKNKLSFSNGVLAPAPKNGASGVPINVKRIYTNNLSSTTGSTPSSSACPTVYGI